MNSFTKKIRIPFLCSIISVICSLTTLADPLDETYRETFYITTIGAFNTIPGSENNIYDYIFKEMDADSSVALAEESDTFYGTHMNSVPWGDTADQTVDILHNYLEKYNGGAIVKMASKAASRFNYF